MAEGTDRAIHPKAMCASSDYRVYVEVDEAGNAVCTSCGMLVPTWITMFLSVGRCYYDVHAMPDQINYDQTRKAQKEASVNKKMLARLGIL